MNITREDVERFHNLNKEENEAELVVVDKEIDSYDVIYKPTKTTIERANKILKSIYIHDFTVGDLAKLFDINVNNIDCFEPIWDYLSRKSDTIPEPLHLDKIKRSYRYRLITETEWELEHKLR